MDPNSRKLQRQTQEEIEAVQEVTSGQVQSSRTFEEVEDLLRYDASRVTLPAAIETRLQESLASVPPARRPWWTRIFRR